MQKLQGCVTCNQCLEGEKGEPNVCLLTAALENMAAQYGILCGRDPLTV